MSNVIMMCGVCGSGKTVYAKQKDKEGFIRLSIDEEMWASYGEKGIDFPESDYDSLSEVVELKLKTQMIELIKKGENIVLDFSFWNKNNRNLYKSLIKEAGGTPQLVYMKADKELLRKRLQVRNQYINANSVFITDEILSHYYDGFEEPKNEDEIVILQK
jgi:predicted kinase